MTDPVCGMEINPELSKFRETYKGCDYFFCGEACQRAFLKNPERHLPWQPGRRDRRKEIGPSSSD